MSYVASFIDFKTRSPEIQPLNWAKNNLTDFRTVFTSTVAFQHFWDHYGIFCWKISAIFLKFLKFCGTMNETMNSASVSTYLKHDACIFKAHIWQLSEKAAFLGKALHSRAQLVFSIAFFNFEFSVTRLIFIVTVSIVFGSFMKESSI